MHEHDGELAHCGSTQSISRSQSSSAPLAQFSVWLAQMHSFVVEQSLSWQSSFPSQSSSLPF